MYKTFNQKEREREKKRGQILDIYTYILFYLVLIKLFFYKCTIIMYYFIANICIYMFQ